MSAPAKIPDAAVSTASTDTTNATAADAATVAEDVAAQSDDTDATANDAVKAARAERDAAKTKRREAEARAVALEARAVAAEKAAAESSAEAAKHLASLTELRMAQVMGTVDGVETKSRKAARALLESAIREKRIDVLDPDAVNAARELLHHDCGLSTSINSLPYDTPKHVSRGPQSPI